VSKKVRFTIYGITIVGVLTWWWMIPSEPSYNPHTFTTKQKKVLITENIRIISEDEINERLQELNKENTQ
jgi:hypothetical protein